MYEVQVFTIVSNPSTTVPYPHHYVHIPQLYPFLFMPRDYISLLRFSEYSSVGVSVLPPACYMSIWFYQTRQIHYWNSGNNYCTFLGCIMNKTDTTIDNVWIISFIFLTIICGGYHPLVFMRLQRQSNKILSWIVSITTRHWLEGPGIELRLG